MIPVTRTRMTLTGSCGCTLLIHQSYLEYKQILDVQNFVAMFQYHVYYPHFQRPRFANYHRQNPAGIFVFH